MDSDEMMIEIISRLPLRASDSIRATSKRLDYLTYDPYLLDLYKKRNNSSIVSGFLVQNKTNNGDHYINEFVASPHSSTIDDLKFLPRKTRIMATNERGITVCEVPHPRHHRIILYHVCKPTTKQVLALPNPKTRFQTAMVAVVTVGSSNSLLHYKILRLSELKKSRPVKYPFTYNCEIFDSTEWAWKWLSPSMLPGDILTNKQPITASGSIYMLLTNGDIFKFDAYSEKQTTFSPPHHCPADCSTLVKYEGKLGFAFQPPNDCWEIWVRTNDGRSSWEKVYVFNPNEDIKRGSLESLYDSDTCIIKDFDRLLFYKFKIRDVTDDMDIKKHEIKLRNIHNDRIFLLRSDSETTNLKGRVNPWIVEQWQSFLPRRLVKVFLIKLYKKIYKRLFKKVFFGLKNLFKNVRKSIRRDDGDKRQNKFIKLDQPVHDGSTEHKQN